MIGLCVAWLTASLLHSVPALRGTSMVHDDRVRRLSKARFAPWPLKGISEVVRQHG